MASMRTAYQPKVKYQNGCYLKILDQSNLLFNVRILAYVHICTKYEVSMLKPMARRAVYRQVRQQWQCSAMTTPTTNKA